jgi:DNA-binding response OmpR family regulator
MNDPSAARRAPSSTTSATILTIEDEPQLLALLDRLLSEQGFVVRGAATGTAGLHLALDTAPDLVVLDVGLPDRSGFEIAAELRRRGVRVPILMLTARDTVHDKVEGLGAGADDYLAKPFDASELVARVRALLRRASLREDDLRVRAVDLELDTVARRVTRGGTEIALTATEYALLEYLMRNAGRELSRETIAAHVWKQPLEPESNIVDVYITYLRKKLDVEGRPKLLHTVRGVGYVLRAEPDGPP